MEIFCWIWYLDKDYCLLSWICNGSGLGWLFDSAHESASYETRLGLISIDLLVQWKVKTYWNIFFEIIWSPMYWFDNYSCIITISLSAGALDVSLSNFLMFLFISFSSNMSWCIFFFLVSVFPIIFTSSLSLFRSSTPIANSNYMFLVRLPRLILYMLLQYYFFLL